MVKHKVPGLKLGGGKGKWVFGALVVLALVLIVKAPIEAAAFGKSVFGAIDTAATSVVTFFNSF
ncbi:hypothetical protein LCL61_06925 [Amycolatopsis coloradensis]|uniref:Uncharacterized protein n=1 Tax=Amycolatopsis coloradensis TaxID=76021 RepID=A0ACD5B7M7_9PSEU